MKHANVTQFSPSAVAAYIAACDLGTDASRSTKRGGQVLPIDPNESALIEFLSRVTNVAQVSQMSQKGIFRLVEAARFCVTGLPGFVDVITGRSVAIVVLECSEGKSVSFTDTRVTLGQNAEGNLLPGVSRERLKAMLPGNRAAGTIRSQCSRTFGTGGFLNGMGVTRGTSRYTFEFANPRHPFVASFVATLNALSPGQFATLLADFEAIDAKASK